MERAAVQAVWFEKCSILFCPHCGNRFIGAPDTARLTRQALQPVYFFWGGDFSARTTAGAEFGNSRRGIGVMHDLDGEIVSMHCGVPVDGKPIRVGPDGHHRW